MEWCGEESGGHLDTGEDFHQADFDLDIGMSLRRWLYFKEVTEFSPLISFL